MISPEIMFSIPDRERREPEVREGIITRRNASVNHGSVIHSVRRGFIHFGDIGDFRRCCAKGTDSAPSCDRISAGA